jgi:RNA polymerase sigma-70 factor (ECF subfamily)
LGGSCPDEELVNRALAGDMQSFVELCERHRERVWRIAVSVAPGPDADDLAQEAVIRAYRALRTYLGEAPFEAWLCRIALNVARDYQRSAWRRRVILFDRLPATEEAPWASPESEAERRDLQRRVRQAVAALPARQRVPIWLHYLEGFTLAEVARLECAPEATIRSRLRAGLRRLSLTLDDLLPGGAECGPPREPQRRGCGV